MEYAESSPWFNNEAYADVLNKEAVERFLAITHDRYASCLQTDFGTLIPSIFTDEPGTINITPLSAADCPKDTFLPWTGGLRAAYRERFQAELLDTLPELIWELPDGQKSLARYRFHNLVADLFVTAYPETIARWCERHGLMPAGHYPCEHTLSVQTAHNGDVMRGYRCFRDMPGVDILCDRHEYNTLKQAQSMKNQQGAKAMLSELYGVSGWDYDFRGFKLQGDWQAALGVTVRVPHLTWMSMEGEAKRDYPVCIGYQSPWHGQFAKVEDHFARIASAMTRGKPQVRVGVVHPIESFWLLWGPDDQTLQARTLMEERFASLTETLLFANIDFDFINEAVLPSQCPAGANPLPVGEMRYDVVILPALKTLRATTLERLAAFAAAGGQLIVLEDYPELLDGVADDRARRQLRQATLLPFSGPAILQALENVRTVEILDSRGVRTDYLIHQLRNEGACKWLFIARGKNPECADVDESDTVTIRITGTYTLQEYDTLTGEIRPLSAAMERGCTVLKRRWHMHDSLLLCLTPGREADVESSEAVSRHVEAPRPLRIRSAVTLQTDEPNVVLLDLAEWSLDGGAWQPEEELLRIDNACRDQIGIPRRARNVVQPYLITNYDAGHRLALRFSFDSEVTVRDARLAMEKAEDALVWLDEEPVPVVTDGYYVDHAIRTVPLPAFGPGHHMLQVTVPLGRSTNLEWCYLLGTFGVRLNGTRKTLTAQPKTVGFGDLVPQGFPFYTGNMTYSFEIEAEGSVSIRIPKYRAAMLQVQVDDRPWQDLIYSPYMVTFRDLEAGRHTVRVKAYGTRRNGFGQVHHEQGVWYYQSPNSWRSTGDLWLYEYQLKPVGVLKTPEIYAGLATIGAEDEMAGI